MAKKKCETEDKKIKDNLPEAAKFQCKKCGKFAMKEKELCKPKSTMK